MTNYKSQGGEIRNKNIEIRGESSKSQEGKLEIRISKFGGKHQITNCKSQGGKIRNKNIEIRGEVPSDKLQIPGRED
jgi:hypothetical protein